MVSHDLPTIKQTVHRMINLQDTIRYDGSTTDIPDLSLLAQLRGIQATHDDEPIQINTDVTKSNLNPIIIVPAKQGDQK